MVFEIHYFTILDKRILNYFKKIDNKLDILQNDNNKLKPRLCLDCYKKFKWLKKINFIINRTIIKLSNKLDAEVDTEVKDNTFETKIVEIFQVLKFDNKQN